MRGKGKERIKKRMEPSTQLFRAWDGRKMYYASLEDLLFSLGSQGAGDWSLVEQIGEELAGFAGRLPGQHSATMLYMQGIGHPDRNGKPIYEGDLLNVRETVWLVEPVGSLERDGQHYGLCASLNGDGITLFIDESILAGEVIGNICEHPELLGQIQGGISA